MVVVYIVKAPKPPEDPVVLPIQKMHFGTDTRWHLGTRTMQSNQSLSSGRSISPGSRRRHPGSSSPARKHVRIALEQATRRGFPDDC